MRRADVLVVGAGPAGTAAAIELARAGRDVVVIDRATFPRDKCCGDGLTTGALRHLDELGLRPAEVPSWQNVADCQIRSPSGRTVEFPLPSTGGFGAVARRIELDAALVALAGAAGAEVRPGSPFRDLRWTASGVTVDAGRSEPVAARYLVAADGMWSPVRRAMGLGDAGYLGEWHAWRQYRSSATAASRHLWILFEEDLLPGYAWSFPLAGGVVNVGFGVWRRHGEPTGRMSKRWAELLGRPHLRDLVGPGVGEAPVRAWPIPAHLGSAPLTGAAGRVLFVGDAARAADPMTGEGIGQALETGRLAAGAVLAAGPHRPTRAATTYAGSLRRGMVIDHRSAAVLARLLERPLGARAAVRVAGASEWTRRNFARWLFEDYPRAVLVTPDRWRPGLFHGPAAFGSVSGPTPAARSLHPVASPG